MALVWIKFVVCLFIIGVAGRKLASCGDTIAEKTGLGGVWVGVTLLALVTSLPELFTGISAVALIDPPAPDLAVGDLFGSNAINLLIIALLDAVHRGSPVLSTARPQGHLLTARLSLILLGICFVCLISNTLAQIGILGIGFYSPILVVLFILMQKSVFGYEQSYTENEPENSNRKQKSIIPEGVTIYRCLIRVPQDRDPLVEFNDEVKFIALAKFAP